MATFSAYANGVTMGVGNAAPVGGKRGEVTGWSTAAVRRHKRWLYSVQASGLDGEGDAVTLTLKHTPPTVDAWRALLRSLFRSLRDHGCLRWHWVVEWQRRGTPHVHLAVYAPPGAPAPGRWVAETWVRLAADYEALCWGQHVTPITGPVGWLKYLSKHAARGVAHYQRCGRPAGWTKTGRLWGYGGSWPVVPPVQGSLSLPEFHRVRRMVRAWAIADARARRDWRAVSYLRGMLACSDRGLSTVRGVSEWVPAPLVLAMAECAGWAGEMPLTASDVLRLDEGPGGGLQAERARLPAIAHRRVVPDGTASLGQ